MGRACARKFGRCGSARTAGTALSTQTNTVTSERDGSTGGLRHSAPDASDGRPTAPPATRASMKQTIAVLDVRQRRATAPAGRCAAEQVLTSLVLPRDVSNPACSASKRKEIRRFCQPLEYERRTSVPLQPGQGGSVAEISGEGCAASTAGRRATGSLSICVTKIRARGRTSTIFRAGGRSVDTRVCA